MIIKDEPSEFKLRILPNADYEDTHTRMLNRTLERIEHKKQTHSLDNSFASTTMSSEVFNDELSTNKNLNNTKLATDELWLVEHNDIYTLGQSGKPEHILERNETPIIKTDRGGQITWHGKGQLVVYWLFDLNTLNWKVRDLVSHAEQAIEDVINQYLIDTPYYAKARSEAPGVYIYARHLQDKSLNSDNELVPVDTKENLTNDDIMLGKIASLGFKIKQGFCYHGIAININCDLTAFNAINPCGYAGMQMLRLQDFLDTANPVESNQSSVQNSLFSEVAQAFVNNVAMRHSGKIALR